jgi:predicted amidohydrolase YtcJ
VQELTPLNPWLAISAAILRRDSQTGQIIVPEERITILQALEMYTRNIVVGGELVYRI